MAPQSTNEIAGLVLAGGRGRRMGGIDKGWVEYRGRPLIETVAERFAPQVGPLIISANRNLARYRALPAVSTVVTDADANFEGPLAGILAALAVVHTPWLAVVPCDAPHLPTDLVQRLGSVLDHPGVAAFARVEQTLQPVFALIACDLQPTMCSYFAAGGRSLRGWLERVGALAVDFDDAAAFRNVNTLDAANGHAA